MSEITIALDAGHGGSDSGAVYKSRKEKDDTLRLTRAVGQILENSGINVYYVREDDEYETPFKRRLMPIMPVRITLYPFTAIPRNARTSTTV